MENSKAIIESICKAFSEVAPQVAATHAANAGGTSAFDVVKGGGEVRKAVQLAQSAVKSGGVDSSTAADCANGECQESACTDGSCEVK